MLRTESGARARRGILSTSAAPSIALARFGASRCGGGRGLRRFGAALALLAAASVAGCGGKAKARAPRVPVTIAAAVERAMPFELISTGTVEPLRTASVGSQVGGVVRSVAFREGDEVSEGQVLFELDPRPFRATLERERAALARDRAQAQAARLDAERAHTLLEQNLLSP